MEGLSQEKQDMIRALADAMGKTPEQLINETMQNKMKKDLTNLVKGEDMNPMRQWMGRSTNPEIRDIANTAEKKEDEPKKTQRKPKAEKKEEAPKKRIAKATTKAKQEPVKYIGSFKCSKCKQDKDASEFEMRGNKMLKTCTSCKDIAMIKKIKGCGAHIKI